MSVIRASISKISISILLRKCQTGSTCSVRPRSSLSSWPLSTRRSLSITAYLNDQNSGKRETSSNRRQVLVEGWQLRLPGCHSEPIVHADSGSVFMCHSCSRVAWRCVQNRSQISFSYVISPTSVLLLRLLWRRKPYNNYLLT